MKAGEHLLDYPRTIDAGLLALVSSSPKGVSMTQKIPLYNRARRALFTLVDDEDYLRIQQFRWRLSSKGYAIRSRVVADKEIVLSLHRQIMVPRPELVVDHRDHDRLNNTRTNLRLMMQQLNLMNRRMFRNNTSGFKGVIY